MKKVSITKVLTIVSVLIIIIGIILGIVMSNTPIEFSNNVEDVDKSDNEMYVDGTDVSDIVSAGESLGTEILGTVMVFAIVFGSIFAVIAIWTIYGIYLIISKTMNKHKQNAWK